MTLSGLRPSARFGSGASGGSGVPTSRNINTTSPLAGGGALSSDLTLSISAASGSAAGSMSSADYNYIRGDAVVLVPGLDPQAYKAAANTDTARGTALQNAIAYAVNGIQASTFTQCTILVRPGSYNITTGQTAMPSQVSAGVYNYSYADGTYGLVLCNGINLVGAGKDITTIYSTNNTITTLFAIAGLINPSPNPTYDQTIRNYVTGVTISHQYVGATSLRACYLNEVGGNCRFEDCAFSVPNSTTASYAAYGNGGGVNGSYNFWGSVGVFINCSFNGSVVNNAGLWKLWDCDLTYAIASATLNDGAYNTPYVPQTYVNNCTIANTSTTANTVTQANGYMYLRACDISNSGIGIGISSAGGNTNGPHGVRMEGGSISYGTGTGFKQANNNTGANDLIGVYITGSGTGVLQNNTNTLRLIGCDFVGNTTAVSIATGTPTCYVVAGCFSGNTTDLSQAAGTLYQIGGNPATTSGTITGPPILPAAHVLGTGSTPAIAAGAALGGTPTVSITGTDLRGVIKLTAGTTPLGSGVLATVTFATAFGAAPFVVLTPANANAALVGTAMVYVTETTTTFVINANGTTGLTTLLEYDWNYAVLG